MKKVILLSMQFVCFFVVSFLLTQTTLAQGNSTVTGKVLDSLGESVIGASVLVKGTTSGTITDIDGNFKLDNVPSNATLVISYIGFKTQEVNVAGKKSFTIQLVDDTQALEEVVVVGYGVQRKSDLTGAVASVKGSEVLKNAPALLGISHPIRQERSIYSDLFAAQRKQLCNYFIQKGQIFLINPANGVEPLGIFRPVISEQDIIRRQAENFTDLN